MIQIGERRRFLKSTSVVPEGAEFIVRNILIHIDTRATYVGCEFFNPLRFGHDLSITTLSYSGYGGVSDHCPEDYGSYFSIDDIRANTESLEPREPDWEV